MKTKRLAVAGATLAVAMLATGCGTMNEAQKGTAVGAGVGGVAGAVISGGSPAGTVAGAVVGGVIGHEVRKDKD